VWSCKAIDAITPNGLLAFLEGRHCLTARSQCYLLLGDHDAALVDAEAALEEDVTFIKVCWLALVYVSGFLVALLQMLFEHARFVLELLVAAAPRLCSNHLTVVIARVYCSYRSNQ
jgi:hypothetical protein